MVAILVLLVFVSAAAGDVVQILGTRAIAAARPSPHRVAVTSVIEWTIGCIGYAVIVITDSLWYLAPEVLGLYLGSYIGTTYARRRAITDEQNPLQRAA